MGEKLLLSLFVQDVGQRNQLPEFSMQNRQFVGCEASLVIFVVLDMQFFCRSLTGNAEEI